MNYHIKLISIFSFVKSITGDKSSLIVGGKLADIADFPHSAHLTITCDIHFHCGASILNQQILLTAGHCYTASCPRLSSYAGVGNANYKKGLKYKVANYKVHEDYFDDADTSYTANDICVVYLKTPMILDSQIGRVAIMKKPPHTQKAIVAGWGYVNEYDRIRSPYLRYIPQRVLSRKSCISLLSTIPKGVFCGKIGGDRYASNGDSGNALVVHKYIQIGVVSYKLKSKDRSLVVYTDVGYFYDWIKRNSQEMSCNMKKNKKYNLT